MPANYNADDPRNPLLALIPQGGNRFGRAGRWMPFDASALDQHDRASYTDPDFWEQYTEAGSEGGGGETRWRPRAEVRERLAGRVQVHDLNVGGPGQIIDPDKVEYDPEFGLVTTPDNIKPDPVRNRQRAAWWTAVMAPAAYAVGANIIAANAAGAAGAADVGLGASEVGTAAAAGAPEAAAVTAPGVQAAAPVIEAGVPAATTPASGGILQPVMNAGNQVSGWYNGLTPAGRLLVSSAVSGGAQALSSASAQRAAQQAATEREERQRQDRIRRGAVPAVTNPYTPRPAGIIGSAFTPRPGGG